jgi:hypothetical protein
MKAKSINRFLYNPARIPEVDFLARFLVRQRQFKRLWEELSSSRIDMVEQSFLIIGQRGMGKTTLMLKAAYEIRRDPKLQQWLVPVVFPEELFGVASLFDLWLFLGQNLDDDFPGLSTEMEALVNLGSEEKLLETIRRRVVTEKKKLVIFLDNFGDLLDRLTETEIHRLREILMTAKDLRIVAASARVMDHTYRYDKPFFDFFNTIYLPALDKDEALKLMEGLAEYNGQKESYEAHFATNSVRLEAIRRLTGGVPRLLILLFSSMMADEGTAVLEDLETILDQVSPYYKHRVEELQSQQRSIFHHVAMAWDAVGAGEIAVFMRMDSRKISAQLQQMVDNTILERIDTGGKKHLYRVQERFFNIWYLMRMAGLKGASRMKWLVSFLEIWLNSENVEDRISFSAKAIGNSPTTYDVAREEPAVYKTRDKRGLEQQLADNDRKDEELPIVLKGRLNDGLAGIAYFFESLNSTRKQQRSGFDANYSFEKPIIHGDALFLLWNQSFLEAQQLSTPYFQENAPKGSHLLYQEFYLLTLLIRYQHHECLKIFESSPHQLKDVYKPIWYALMKLMGPSKRLELLRMGSELAETVDEIVAFVERMRVKYPG